MFSSSRALYWRRMTSVRTPYRSSQVHNGICCRMWRASSSVLPASPNSYSYLNLSRYPARVICTRKTSLAHNFPLANHQSNWWRHGTAGTYGSENGSQITRSLYGYRGNKLLHWSGANLAACTRDRCHRALSSPRLASICRSHINAFLPYFFLQVYPGRYEYSFFVMYETFTQKWLQADAIVIDSKNTSIFSMFMNSRQSSRRPCFRTVNSSWQYFSSMRLFSKMASSDI